MAVNEQIYDDEYRRYHYAKSNGWLAEDEWIVIGNNSYYFDEVGEMLPDTIISYKGFDYYVFPDGRMAKDEKFYYNGYEQHVGPDRRLLIHHFT